MGREREGRCDLSRMFLMNSTCMISKIVAKMVVPIVSKTRIQITWNGPEDGIGRDWWC